MQRVRDGPQELDVLNWMGRTALEVIAQGGLGVSIDPLTRDTNDEYSQALKDFVFVVVLPKRILTLFTCSLGLRYMASAPCAS